MPSHTYCHYTCLPGYSYYDYHITDCIDSTIPAQTREPPYHIVQFHSFLFTFHILDSYYSQIYFILHLHLLLTIHSLFADAFGFGSNTCCTANCGTVTFRFGTFHCADYA